MEVSEYLVGSPAFKAGDTGDPRMAGSIPVHLRQKSAQAKAPDRPKRRCIYGLRVAVLIVISSLLMPGSASAQARLLESTPPDGASLSNLQVVVFEFDTLLRQDDASVRVLRRDGTEITVTSVAVSNTELTARIDGQLPSGNYEISYAVEGSDGRLNEGSIRVSVDSPDQALSGGLLAVIGIGLGMTLVLTLVFINDKRRRPAR